MDKPKESDARTRVMDILRNHDQEARVIEAQIAAEKESLEYDMGELLLSGAYPSTAINPTGVRVSSSHNPDGKLISTIERRQRRQTRADEAIAGLEEQLRQIEAVRIFVYQLDTRSKCVLLALYYPYRSYNEAADFLQTERTTIYRQRKIALERLFSKAERSNLFDGK